jgi:hypothetical protein
MENMENIGQVWKSLPEEIQDALKKAVDEAASEEQFVSEIMIGACPKCKGTATRDCDEVARIQDCTIGLCMDCGHLFCSECRRDLSQTLNCKHWEICENCIEADENFTCEIGPEKCKKLKSEISGAE